METSRIFVRGLPPSLTEKDFKTHFASRYTVTDTKLFPQRRFGYVGLKDAMEAASAVKYFNRTFIRMSKIHVELTENKPAILQRHHPTSLNKRPAQPLVESTSLKRKREAAPLVTVALPKPTIDPLDIAGTNTDNDEPRHSQSIVQDDMDHTQKGDQPKEPNDDGSDMDWMRTRTSRLLGLVEDDEVEVAHGVRDRSNYSTAPGEIQDTSTSKNVAETATSSTQTEIPHELDDEPIPEVESADVQAIQKTGRLYLRNLSYETQEDDIHKLFDSIGTLQEVHVSHDLKTGRSKGMAFVQFESPEHAVKAFQEYDGTVLQGRLLHIIPGAAKRESKMNEYAISQLPLKQQRLIQRKSESRSAQFNWSFLYMNPDAVMSSVAERLGISKSELLDPTSSDSAVRQAQAETHVIQETKNYFESNGVNLASLNNRSESGSAIWIKNFAYGTKTDELKTMFGEFGKVERILMPPSGTTAIIELENKFQANTAYNALSNRRFKDSMLFLQKTPEDIFAPYTSKTNLDVEVQESENSIAAKTSAKALMDQASQNLAVNTSTLFVRNLSFATNNEKFQETFKPLDGFISARVKTKPDPKKPGSTLSMGFGFLEFKSNDQAKAAIVAMDGYNLDGHQLQIKPSQRALDAGEERRKQDSSNRQAQKKSKIIIKNLPFEATKDDVRKLFRSYGQLRTVRVPKKFDNTRKGFAFAEFTTPREAENAMDSLQNTHLLGRRLVLDYAAGEVEDPEEEIAKMQQKTVRSVNSQAYHKMAATERKKVDLGSRDDVEDV